MTVIDSILDLFAQVATPGKDVVWLADQLLAVAPHVEPIDISDSAAGELTPDRAAIFRRLFRPLLARVAKLAADETGTEFDPYHGNYTLTRAGRHGACRLEIDITNTPAVRRLRITPLPTPPSPTPASQGTTSPQPQQPTG